MRARGSSATEAASESGRSSLGRTRRGHLQSRKRPRRRSLAPAVVGGQRPPRRRPPQPGSSSCRTPQVLPSQPPRALQALKELPVTMATLASLAHLARRDPRDLQLHLRRFFRRSTACGVIGPTGRSAARPAATRVCRGGSGISRSTGRTGAGSAMAALRRPGAATGLTARTRLQPRPPLRPPPLGARRPFPRSRSPTRRAASSSASRLLRLFPLGRRSSPTLGPRIPQQHRRPRSCRPLGPGTRRNRCRPGRPPGRPRRPSSQQSAPGRPLGWPQLQRSHRRSCRPPG
mmetsp:Transcript_40109/g.111485  ORF Transcript_40109/g.111485 Transcript_40109/m.111485 type:complete len:289 (-) Transcript_40109:775-1641(-)